MKMKRGTGEIETTITADDGNHYECTVFYSGYSDPGRLYGRPEDCCPAEGEIEILKVAGLPLGVEVDEAEVERIEELCFQDLERPQEREYEPS